MKSFFFLLMLTRVDIQESLQNQNYSPEKTEVIDYVIVWNYRICISATRKTCDRYGHSRLIMYYWIEKPVCLTFRRKCMVLIDVIIGGMFVIIHVICSSFIFYFQNLGTLCTVPGYFVFVEEKSAKAGLQPSR